MRSIVAIASVLALALPAAALETPPQEQPPIERLSLEELMNVEVVSASNTGEMLSRAPATVIVIGRDDIEARGYRDLSQILDDLPGMEVVRPYGATYLKNYWRGYRNTVGDPFLLLIDGIVFNHLYFNSADVMVTFPLSDIDRVEVVYGPASSVYGANAFMGVINVITRSEQVQDGSKAVMRLAGGSFDTRLADVTYFYHRDDLRLRISGRLDDGNLDPASGEQYEYTRQHYYADRQLWGGFVDNPSLGGDFSSPRQNRAVDLRAWLGSLEAGVQYFRMSSGYGLEYAGDRAQNHAVWSRPDFSAHLRYQHRFSDASGSTTLVRYRSSGVSNDSYFVENSANNGEPRAVDFSYWSSANSSVSLFQDFDYQQSARLSFTAGFKYEQKDLQKAYATGYGPSLPPGEIDAAHYPYPDQPPDSAEPQNAVTTEDVGAYVQTWFQLSGHHQLNVGLRSDDNSKYGRANTLRAGYVGNFGPWTFKTLYGEAFQEPNNRLLYGGWDGSGSDPQLDPETSHTLEMSGSYSRNDFFTLLSVYHIDNQNTFINTSQGAQNLGDRHVVGLDYHVQRVFDLGSRRSVKVWGYYSHIFSAKESTVSDPGAEDSSRGIGDLAHNKILAGATFRANHASATLRGRWIDDRPTVVSNPVGDVPSYATLDANVRWDDVFAKGVGVSLAIENLTDKKYSHPGVRDANAGTTPGSFDANGAWTGSGGFFNSLLPQPGRSALLSVHLTLE